MPAGMVIAFFVLFVLILIAVSVGLKFFDARRKSQVGKMLSTAAGEPVVTVTKLLKELAPEGGSGFRGALERFKFTKHAQEQIQQAGMNWSPTRMLSAMGLAAIPGFGIGTIVPFILNGPLTAILLGVAFASAPYLYIRRKRKQRMDLLEEQFPESLDFLARSMRAGHAFSMSLEMLGEEMADPLGQEYRTLFNEQNLGAPLDVALRNFADRVPLLDVRFFTSSVLLQKQTGGNLSEILGRLAYVIRERFRLKGQVKAASAHGRMTATILTLLPVATMILLLVVAPGYLQGMAADSTGKQLIGGAIVAQLLGNFFIRKIINIKV
jgi:tight adherence protein B